MPVSRNRFRGGSLPPPGGSMMWFVTRRSIPPPATPASAEYHLRSEMIKQGPARENGAAVRIELTTSALPRMRSTTELRQHFFRSGAPMKGGPTPVNPVASR